MFGFQVRNRQNVVASQSDPASPITPAVGEIDTKAPFESVKAAVTLFIEASPKADIPVLKKSRTMDQESLLGNETQLHWILKEIDKYKEHMKTAESTKGQALKDLEKANNALKELNNKLQAVSRSKQASIESTEAAKTRVNQLEQLKSTTTNQEAWQEAVDKERNQYKTVSDQLISAKQQLNNLKQDFDIALEAKLASFQRAAEAQSAAELNRTKIDVLSKEFDEMSQTLERVKLASAKDEEDHAKLMEEKQAIIDSKRNEKEDIELRIQCLRNANSEERVETRRLDETSEAVNALRDQLKEVRDADMDVLRNANLEVEEAKKRLEEMQKEETSVRDVVESLKQELENVKRDIAVFKGDDLEGEKLRAELDHSKQQVHEASKGKTKAKNYVKEMESKIGEMSLKAEKARKKEEETKTKVETLWREAQHSEVAMREAEAKLEIAQREVQEAKEAKELADDQIRSSSTKDDVADDTNLNSDFDSDTPEHQSSTIKLTTQDFEALSRKVEEATTAADTKVATIMDQVETIKQKEKGIIENLEKSMQENKEIQEEITKAQESAQVADAATHTLETQLNRWRSDHTRGS
ncbi:WEB family protein-like protein [Tanacetum coccineum]